MKGVIRISTLFLLTVAAVTAGAVDLPNELPQPYSLPSLAQMVHFITLNNPHSNFTLFLPISPPINATDSFTLSHTIARKLSFHDLQTLPQLTTFPSLLPGYLVLLNRTSALSTAPILVNGVLLCYPDLVNGPQVAVHGVDGVIFEDSGEGYPHRSSYLLVEFPFFFGRISHYLYRMGIYCFFSLVVLGALYGGYEFFVIIPIEMGYIVSRVMSVLVPIMVVVVGVAVYHYSTRVLDWMRA